MNNKTTYFFSIFGVLLMISFFGFINVFAAKASGSRTGGWRITKGSTDLCIITSTNYVSGSNYDVYYLDGENPNYDMFAPTASKDESDTLRNNWPGDVESCSHAYTGTSYRSSNCGGNWDLNCNGSIDHRWTAKGYNYCPPAYGSDCSAGKGWMSDATQGGTETNVPGCANNSFDWYCEPGETYGGCEAGDGTVVDDNAPYCYCCLDHCYVSEEHIDWDRRQLCR